MKFTQFKEFKDVFSDNVNQIIFNYLSFDMPKFLRELSIGLNRLSFVDNFNAFSVRVTINAGQELAIRNQLRSKEIPTQRIITRGGSGSQNVVDGDTPWSQDFVYLKNTGGSAVTVTVVFING